MNPGIYVVIGALPAALASVIIYARRFSGKIRSSEAVTLWEAQEEFRKDLTERNNKLRGYLDRCEAKIDDLEKRLSEMEAHNIELRLENGELKARLLDFEGTITELRAEVGKLQHDNTKLTRENTALKKRVKELEEHNA